MVTTLSRSRAQPPMLVFTLLLLVGVGVRAVADGPPDRLGAVQALFDLGAPTGGPFPSDWFTVPDASHNTGRRVNLPLPDCTVRVSDCEDINVLNELDGFNLQPRLSIPFDGPIDINSVTSDTVFLISLGSTLDDGGDPPGTVVGINQIVWDTFTNTLHVESDALLDQHTWYALIVTNGLRDATGSPVEPTEAFRRFRQTVPGEYKHALLEAIGAAQRLGVRERQIVTASVFTTQSVTAILEKIRDQIKSGTPDPADFNLGPDGTRTVFWLDEVNSITFRQQTGANPPSFTNSAVRLDLLRMIPGAVGQIAFGKYLSPDYEIHPDEFIPPVGTQSGTPQVQRVNELFFNLYVPSGPKPAGGWPVAILGHGGTGSKERDVFSVAAAAHQGIATIAANAPGRGFGPLGTLTVNRTVGGPVTFPSGGRGSDQDGNHIIEANEGADATQPRRIIGQRDAQRQTAADLMQLVRVIEGGIDVDGDGVSDVDSSGIYYFGISFGGAHGIISLAVEPSIRVGVFNVPGGAAGRIDLIRLRPAGRGNLVGRALASRVPSLITAPGVTRIDGITVSSPHFNENMPLRDGVPLAVVLEDGRSYDIQSPVINTVPGAMEIQQVFEHAEWISQSGDTTAYAPYLRKRPLPGMPAKSVVLQIAKGDQTGPNPRTTATVRAGDLADATTFYRNDLTFAEDDRVPRNPHDFVTRIDSAIPLVGEIALGAQEQIVVFFASDGMTVIHPEPRRFFEVPILLPLPEGLNFIPDP